MSEDLHLGLPDVAGKMSKPTEAERALRTRLEAKRRDPMRYGHIPHWQQEEFLACEARYRISVSANRVGKTEVLIRDGLWRARGNHPYLKLRKREQIWIGCPDFPSFQRYQQPMFDRWCPPGWLKKFYEADRIAEIKREDGGICTIFFLSYDMPRTKWQGAGVDDIYLDEEPKEDIVKECVARIVTTIGSMSLLFTAVDGVGWWYDAIYLPATMGQNKWVPFTWALAEFDEENEADFNVGKPLVPHISRETIIDFASNYPDPDDRAIRVFGEVRGKRGLVYKGFSKDVHIVPPFEIPRHYELWGAVDPGYHGFGALIAALSPEERTFVVKEYFSQQETTLTRFQALAERVRLIRKPEPPIEAETIFGQKIVKDVEPIVVVFFVDTEDPQVVLELNTRAVEAAEQDARDRKEPVILAFASLEQGLKAIKAGVLRVQQVLQPLPPRATPELVKRPRPARKRGELTLDIGEPQLYFFSDLYSEWQGEDRYYRESRTLWEIARFSWKKPPRGITVQPDEPDNNTAAGAHLMAVLRYLVQARLSGASAPADNQDDGLSQADREVWDDMEELERIQQAG